MGRSTVWIRRTGIAVVALMAFPLADVAGQEQPHRDALGNIDFALTGDAIITRKLSVYQEQEFLEIRDLIRNATAAFTNAEVLFLDYDEPDVIPSSSSGGTYMRAEPEMAEELTWMGIDMVSLANNHTMDYGVGGLRAHMKWVEAAGLVAAGAGERLAEARAPGYLETPGGRVALISISSSFNDLGRAGPQRRDLRGRPGLSPMRYQTIYTVPGDRFETLVGLVDDLGLRGTQEGNEIRLFGETFKRGNAHSVTTRVDQADMAELAAEIRDAKRQANWVIVTSHSHEGGASRDVPADFVEEFARASIDAGADMWVGHGPHVLRGIEIYNGKPIFYSLGDFIMQNETVELQPADNYASQGLGNDDSPADFYDTRIAASPTGSFPGSSVFWEAVVAIPAFKDGHLAEIRLHPITLGHGLPRPQRGRPLAAKGELAGKIIADLQRLSEPYGTNIVFENGIGVIRVTLTSITENNHSGADLRHQ